MKHLKKFNEDAKWYDNPRFSDASETYDLPKIDAFYTEYQNLPWDSDELSLYSKLREMISKLIEKHNMSNDDIELVLSALNTMFDKEGLLEGLLDEFCKDDDHGDVDNTESDILYGKYSREDMLSAFNAGQKYCASEGKVYPRSPDFDTFIKTVNTNEE